MEECRISSYSLSNRTIGSLVRLRGESVFRTGCWNGSVPLKIETRKTYFYPWSGRTRVFSSSWRWVGFSSGLPGWVRPLEGGDTYNLFVSRIYLNWVFQFLVEVSRFFTWVVEMTSSLYRWRCLKPFRVPDMYDLSHSVTKFGRFPGGVMRWDCPSGKIST